MAIDPIETEIMIGANPGSDEEEAYEAVRAGKAEKSLVNFMEKRRIDTQLLLRSSAGRNTRCIYRIPPSVLHTNPHAYVPQLVSIGPYHHGEKHLRAFEDAKWQYLNSMLLRTQKHDTGLDDYLNAIKPLEKDARDCYSETIPLDSGEFIQMMVLDGCFVIDFLHKVTHNRDVLTPRILSYLSVDLFLLENQLPWFILQLLFDLTKENNEISLTMLAINYFRTIRHKIGVDVRNDHDLKGKHLLDICRASIISEDMKEEFHDPPCTTELQCVTKLQLAGVKFRAVDKFQFLDVKFTNGVLEIPMVDVDISFISFLQNCAVFEQSHSLFNLYITTYAVFMNRLIRTPKDVELLCDCKIIRNYFGSEVEIVRFFDDPLRRITLNDEYIYLTKQFQGLQAYCRSDWNVCWTSFKETYFSTPWSLIATLAALALLLLTIEQAVFTTLDYVRPPS